VVWEIEPLARDRVTAIEIGYWVNKMLALPGDTVAFEIGRIELQQVILLGSIECLPKGEVDSTFRVSRCILRHPGLRVMPALVKGSSLGPYSENARCP